MSKRDATLARTAPLVTIQSVPASNLLRDREAKQIVSRPLNNERVRRWSRLAAGMVMPYTVVQLRNQRFHDRRRSEAMRRVHERLAQARERGQEPFDYQAAVDFLVRSRGLDELQVLDGSMPLASLEFAADIIERKLTAAPVAGLQVGNFVGVSLAYFSSLLRHRHQDSVMVSIDPNITHRGVGNPQSHVWALLERFDLLDHNMVITAYSLEQSVGDTPEEGADVTSAEQRGQHALRNLALLAPQQIGVAIIDGNHEGPYLERELAELRRLLAPGAVIVVDDVDQNFEEIRSTFDRAVSTRGDFIELGRDGRIGVLQLAH